MIQEEVPISELQIAVQNTLLIEILITLLEEKGIIRREEVQKRLSGVLVELVKE